MTGTQGADSLRRSFDVLQSTGCAGTNALTMITGVPASITAQMIARGQITATGVRPPEAVIATQPFLAELGSRGITIHECEERRRMLPVAARGRPAHTCHSRASRARRAGGAHGGSYFRDAARPGGTAAPSTDHGPPGLARRRCRSRVRVRALAATVGRRRRLRAGGRDSC
ncbi:MAG: hypothetical protein HY615_16695 [Candidatus Rokubacteria bacterium]|nr:hypothetical protein [Candidatus Rokubacteria bacterium]